MTVRIYALTSFSNLSVCCLGGSSDPVVGAFFETNSLDCYSVARGGQLQVWESNQELEDMKPLEAGAKKKKKKEKEEDEDDVKEESEKKADELTADDTTGKESRMVYKRSARHYLRDHLEG